MRIFVTKRKLHKATAAVMDFVEEGGQMRIDTLVDDISQLALTPGRLRSIGHE